MCFDLSTLVKGDYLSEEAVVFEVFQSLVLSVSDLFVELDQLEDHNLHWWQCWSYLFNSSLLSISGSLLCMTLC